MRFLGLFLITTLIFCLPVKEASAYETVSQQELYSFDEDIVYKNGRKRTTVAKTGRKAPKYPRNPIGNGKRS